MQQYGPAVSSGNTLLTAGQLKDICWFLKGNFLKVERFLCKVEAQNEGGKRSQNISNFANAVWAFD